MCAAPVRQPSAYEAPGRLLRDHGIGFYCSCPSLQYSQRVRNLCLEFLAKIFVSVLLCHRIPFGSSSFPTANVKVVHHPLYYRGSCGSVLVDWASKLRGFYRHMSSTNVRGVMRMFGYEMDWSFCRIFCSCSSLLKWFLIFVRFHSKVTLSTRSVRFRCVLLTLQVPINFTELNSCYSFSL